MAAATPPDVLAAADMFREWAATAHEGVACYQVGLDDEELATLETMVPIVACLYYHETRGKRFQSELQATGSVSAGWVSHQPIGSTGVITGAPRLRPSSAASSAPRIKM